jgi:predicted acyltransferase
VLQRIAICYLIASIIFMYTDVKDRSDESWTISLIAGSWSNSFGALRQDFEPTGDLCGTSITSPCGHTWRGAPVPGFDPEGILSTIPAIATTLLGVLTGHWLRSDRSQGDKTDWMFVAGNFLLLLGVILDMWLPINKNLWTSTYTIFMAGWANVCLAMFYWLIDVKGYKKWATPFVIYGMNAITVFVLRPGRQDHASDPVDYSGRKNHGSQICNL